MKVMSAALLLATLPLLAYSWWPPVGSCLEVCCCKVCSAPSNEAYPYGLTTIPLAENPAHPIVAGSTCTFPVWSDREYNDTDGNPAAPPDTLWWTSFAVFGNFNPQAAPSTCSCCQFSRVDTSCYEERPRATRPKLFSVSSGSDVVQYASINLTFDEGYQLDATDIVEIRNDTHCGYTTPPYVQRSDSSELVVDASSRQITWVAPRLPKAGCYRVCYYHSNLTTPTWYFIDDLRVFLTPIPTISLTLDPLDVPLSGNSVSITFKGKNLLSVFDDVAEFRTSGGCGSGSPTVSSDINGSLDVVNGAMWCKPPLAPRLTTLRPLQRIDPTYAECPDATRLSQDQLVWSLTLPASATYTVCFYAKGAWTTVGTFDVVPQETALNALKSLYTATNGGNWHHRVGWEDPAETDPCKLHGIRCESGNVVAIYLARNNLVGTLPSSMFLAQYFLSLTSISLEENTLSGTVPFEIGDIRNLRYLNLGFNNLSGILPISLQRTSMVQFYVANNDFDGPVPNTVEDLNLLWTRYNGLTIEEDAAAAPLCPTDVLECSDRGSTDDGITACGYDGITEAECVVRGCCFNAQAPLVFGGSACFTKRSKTYFTHPPCSGTSSCVKQYPPSE